MAEIVLHIGVQKTATSLIRHQFKQNREALARLGVVYPLLRLDYDHYLLASPWSQTEFKDSFFFPYGASGYFDRVMRRYSGGSDTLFLTSGLFYMIGESIDKVRDFRSRFAGFDRARLILVVRTQPELIQSIWMEACKQRTAPLDPARFIDHAIETHRAIGKPVEFLNIFQNFAEVFGADNVTVVNYDSLRTAPGGPFGFMLRDLGIDVAPEEIAGHSMPQANVSPDPLASAVFRQIFIKDTLDEGFIGRISRLIKGGTRAQTTMFTREQAARVRQEFAPVNRAFVDAVRQSQPDFQFSIPDLPPGTIFREDLTAQTWAQIARLAAERSADRPHMVRWQAFKRRLPPALTRYARYLPGRTTTGTGSSQKANPEPRS